ncbi:PfaD family polyunsaturated fatty acid/polyketide biosynthesis protein [Williamsia phyllosphaerae]|uniref:2-nitropropane dioxygenase n=1 Tax=Williamsia phyllosphaerae TaxID=885042 RepID=A0ABQ1V1N4_9NOCA|nr:PfaD family polyunsaturated fatty acid/polyketide biosynthesis protein [Williamsia phyllosphaerae]GGF34093.1 2-nitropropane dioxygenase [Williamsia phyllosphaerae]
MTLASPTRTAPDAAIGAALADLASPVWVVRGESGVTVTGDPAVAHRSTVIAAVGPLAPESLGERGFAAFHGVRAAYMAGAMANGIASVDLVAAMARAGYLASYGAAGVVPATVDSALAGLRRTLGDIPFACNVIHSPSEPALERGIVDACLRHGVRCVEASAFMSVTAELVRYRARGLRTGSDGDVVVGHRVIAKVSRTEVAEAFLRPAPSALVETLRVAGEITDEQARLVQRVPMADDITVEADSGGHTDRRPLVVALPEIIAVRDRLAVSDPLSGRVRIGAAGGIGTPAAAAAAFALGAAYIVTGSINQATVEAGQSTATKELLATASASDCAMAPSSDMFELGVTVQVLRRGTMFASRAQSLFETYRRYDSIDDIPAPLRASLEKSVFRRDLDSVWDECVRFFTERDPAQITAAADDPRRKMALIFRWYLGLSSAWSIAGETSRATDYQVWCGPAMGAFNAWVAGTHLESPGRRGVVEVAEQILTGAAHATRISSLRAAGLRLPAMYAEYRPHV